MAKGYWIVRVDVQNEEGMKPHAAASAVIYKKFGGRYLVRSNKCEVPEGTTRSRLINALWVFLLEMHRDHVQRMLYFLFVGARLITAGD